MSTPKLSIPEEKLDELDVSLQKAASMYGKILYDGIWQTQIHASPINQMVFQIGTQVFHESYVYQNSKQDCALDLFSKAMAFILFALDDDIQELKLELGDISKKPPRSEAPNDRETNLRIHEILNDSDGISKETLRNAYDGVNKYITFFRIGDRGHSRLHNHPDGSDIRFDIDTSGLAPFLIHHLLAQRLLLVQRLESPERNTQLLLGDQQEWNHHQDSKKRKKGASDSD